MLVFEHETHCSFANLWRIPAGVWHGSILSTSGASTKPGAVQFDVTTDSTKQLKWPKSGRWDPGLTLLPINADDDSQDELIQYDPVSGWRQIFEVNSSSTDHEWPRGDWDPGLTLVALNVDNDSDQELIKYNRKTGYRQLFDVTTDSTKQLKWPKSGRWDPGLTLLPINADDDSQDELIQYDPVSGWRQIFEVNSSSTDHEWPRGTGIQASPWSR